MRISALIQLNNTSRFWKLCQNVWLTMYYKILKLSIYLSSHLNSQPMQLAIHSFAFQILQNCDHESNCWTIFINKHILIIFILVLHGILNFLSGAQTTIYLTTTATTSQTPLPISCVVEAFLSTSSNFLRISSAPHWDSPFVRSSTVLAPVLRYGLASIL